MIAKNSAVHTNNNFSFFFFSCLINVFVWMCKLGDETFYYWE